MTRTFNHFKKTMLLAAVILPAFLLSGCQEKESPVTTELKLESSTLNVPAEGGDAVMNYTVTNPIEGAKINAGSQAGWLHDFDCSEEGRIRFIVDENPEVGQTRTATVTVTYNDGAIEDEFTVLQGEGVGKAPFEITITEIGYDYAIADITPFDPQMTYLVSYYEQQFLNQFDSVDPLIEQLLNDYVFIASMAGLDLKTFLETQILIKGNISDYMCAMLSTNTDHSIFAVGLDSDGKILTDWVKEPFTTKQIEMIDITFDVSCNVNGPNVILKTIPSNKSIRYYTDVKLQSDFPEDMDLQYWIHQLIWRGNITGDTTEEVIEEISSFGDVEKEYYLNANSDYYAFAVAINDQGIINSELEIIDFSTGNVLKSDNTFEISTVQVGVDYAEILIRPSNNDIYSWAVSPVSDWEGMTEEEYMEQYLEQNAAFLWLKENTGESTVTANNLTADTEYYAFVFGYEQYVMTTDVTKIKFTTGGADNPEDLTFDFTIGTVTSTSVDVKVVGTPEKALYYWDVIDASATEEVAKETLDARVQRWIDIGYKTDRAAVFQEMAVRGTVETTVTSYNFGYNSIEPGKEYKLYAVGIYDETGEYATDFVFSEPFTTPAN